MRLGHAGLGIPARRSARTGPLRAIAAALGCLGLTAVLAGCGSSGPGGASDGQVIRVAVVPGIDTAALELAVRDGLFAQAGIDVKLAHFATVSSELSALSNGSVNIAAGDYGSLFAAQATAGNKIFTILADGYDAAPGVLEIMTMPNSKITSPAGLVGRRIGAPDSALVGAPADAPDSLAIASATSVLQGYGINTASVTWQTMSQQQEVGELIDGKLPAILVTEPYIYQAQRVGAVELADACSGATESLPLSGYFSTKAWSENKDNAAAVRAFESAIMQADAKAAMPGPIQSVLPGYVGLTAREAALITLGVYPLSTIAASVQRTADLMNTEGMIRYEINVAGMIVRLRRPSPGELQAVACVKSPRSFPGRGR